MTAKELVIERTRELSDDATLEEIVDELQILVAIREGQKAVAEGRYITHEEMKRRIGEWRSERSGKNVRSF